MLLQAIHSASAPSNWYRQCHFGDALRSCTPSAVTLLLAAMACQTAAAAPAQPNASIPRYECPPSVPVGVSSAAALPGWATYRFRSLLALSHTDRRAARKARRACRLHDQARQTALVLHLRPGPRLRRWNMAGVWLWDAQ